MTIITADNEVADILVIGAGASGAALSWQVARDGFKVICLEQGRWHNPEDYATTVQDWEFQAMTTWNYNPNLRQLSEDYPVNDAKSPIAPLMFNAVGGSTIHYTAHTPRLHPSDFRVRSLDGVADDWPLSYKDLEPFYDLNDEVMGCSGIAGDPANPPRTERQMPPLPLGEDGTLIARAFDSLDWHWWPSDSYVNSIPYGDGRDACNFCGANGMGCTRKAKASTDVTYWPSAIQFGVELRTDCRVTEITVDELGMTTGAHYITRDGRLHHQPARSVVLAANGIGTPRLMLLSKSDAHPNGLANSSGLVGKNLMFHPYASVTGVFEQPLDSWTGPVANILMSQEFYETDPRRDFLRGYSYQVARGFGPALTAKSRPISWGDSHHEEFTSEFGKTMTLAVIGEDLPELHNTVTLDPALTDRSGLPAPAINYKLSQNSRQMLDHGISKGRILLEAAGAHTIHSKPLIHQAGWHLMGTARMGFDPEASVVGPFGQAHDVENLFIVDGSVFVTAGAVNPTPTIQALALRTANYITSERTDLKIDA